MEDRGLTEYDLAGRREQAQRLVLVTGPSGAGRSTAINVLEDLGFEAIDNLPLSLIPRLLDGRYGRIRWRWGWMCATGISRPRISSS